MVDFPYKILVPQRAAHLVSRPRLNELLGAIANKCLITISGPAGYGKTSLLVDFAAVSSLPVCWYALDPSDQDPWVFLDYLVGAIEHRFPGATARTAALLSTGGRTSFPTIVSMLVRELYTVGHDFVVILDDWHVVDHIPEIKDIVTHLLLHCPHCHLILASRCYPSLPNMMLLTARRQMNSFNESQLRFTAAEVASVLEAGFAAAISEQEAAALAEQAHGWITGILLSYHTAHLAASEPLFGNTFAERQIYRYLVEQVFDQQAAEIQEFLLDSALLDELTPENCDTIFQRDDSRRLLERLLRQHLFISEIRPGVLRYHSLFREFLQEHYRTVDPPGYHAAARRVACFYAAQGQGVLAFERYIAVGDHAAAREVIAASGEQLYINGRLETLDRLFAALPEDQLDARLLCLKARIQLDLGRDSQAQMLANLAETLARPEERPRVTLLQAQLARIDGRYEHALALAQQVLGGIQQPGQRAAALRTIAICHHRLGTVECAIAELEQALEIERQAGNLHAVAQLQHDLGLCYRDVGMLDMAVEYDTQSDSYWAAIGNTGLRAMSLNSKGEVQLLAGRYTDAHSTLVTALRFARESAIPHYQAAVLGNLGDLYCALQLWERARSTYADACKAGGSGYQTHYLALADIRFLLRQRKYEEAARAVRQLPQTARRYFPHEVLLLTAAAAAGSGDHEQAACLTQQVIDALERTRAPLELARAYLLQAQISADVASNRRGMFIGLLDRAAAIADQLGHDDFLVAETFHMRGLVRRAAAAGWERAENWIQRHRDMRLAAQMLDQDDQRPLLMVRTLGVDQIILNGQPVKLGWNKAREVLYYLLAHPDGASIDTLRERIWPDRTAEQSRDALRSAIYHLRTVLPHDLIALHGRQVYRINRDHLRVDYDVERFLNGVEAGAGNPELLLEELDLYRGLYLSFTDSHWCVALRTQLERRYMHALHRAAAFHEQEHAHADALLLYQRILAVDTLDEAAHAGVMRCQIALDNRAAAINQYHTLRRALDEELGLNPEPASEAEQLYRQLLSS